MSGTDRLSYVREVAALARQHGHEVAVFDVKEIMFQIAADRGQPVEEETILDAAGSTLEALRAAALEHVLRLADTTPHFILATHALFRWRNALIPGFDVHYLSQIQPDLYVTISDTITAIKGQLDRQARWRHYSYNDLLIWRDEETFVTEMMASFQRKRHYLIARDQPPDTLYRLMFRPEAKTVYRSYPITHIVDQPGLLAECDALGAQLDEHFVVFDPMAIKDLQALDRASPPSHRDSPSLLPQGRMERGPGGKSGHAVSSGPLAAVRRTDGTNVAVAAAPGGVVSPSPRGEGEAVLADRSAAEVTFNPAEMQYMDDQTVARDYKLIKQSDLVVVYYPTTVLSAGVICEMIYAVTNGKQVFAVWLPPTDPSPFFSYYCTEPVFRSVDALFAYFDRAGLAGDPARD
ncbi:MAG: hypothetical protein CL878_08295 [Dehalococcoidia bacterium]|nr:hypothetical protein [Dehalococcoidia bacterium]